MLNIALFSSGKLCTAIHSFLVQNNKVQRPMSVRRKILLLFHGKLHIFRKYHSAHHVGLERRKIGKQL